MHLAQTYGKLPHELLHLSIAELNFDIAITSIGNRKMQEMSKEKKSSEIVTEDNQMSLPEFERIFNVEKG